MLNLFHAVSACLCELDGLSQDGALNAPQAHVVEEGFLEYLGKQELLNLVESFRFLDFANLSWHLIVDDIRYINNILTVGMVPALFPDDEKEPLVGAIRARRG